MQTRVWSRTNTEHNLSADNIFSTIKNLHQKSIYLKIA